MTATINGKRYRIEFSYRRRTGKKASLARNSPIEGLSACAIVSDGGAGGYAPNAPVVAVAASVCSAGDNWSRAAGRRQAFERAIDDCGILRKDKEAFDAWFRERFPASEPTRRERPVPITDTEKRIRIELGGSKRVARLQRATGTA